MGGTAAHGLRERRPRALLLDGERVEVLVRESSRTRLARIAVGPRRPLEIVVPLRVTNAEIDRILESRRAWIREQRARLRELASRPGRLGLIRPGFAALAGDHVPIELIGGARSLARLRGGRLAVGGPVERAGQAIARWYRHEARRRVGAQVEREAARLGLPVAGVAIRDQRTRWGSCSSTGTLSFSWRLLLAPPAVLDYVVVHELCHLREPNHSQRFWHLVEGARPGWRTDAHWLRSHADELHAYAPEVHAYNAAALVRLRPGPS